MEQKCFKLLSTWLTKHWTVGCCSFLRIDNTATFSSQDKTIRSITIITTGGQSVWMSPLVCVAHSSDELSDPPTVNNYFCKQNTCMDAPLVEKNILCDDKCIKRT